MRAIIIFFVLLISQHSFAQDPLFRSLFEYPNTEIYQAVTESGCFSTTAEYNRADITGDDPNIYWPSDWQSVLVDNIEMGNFDRFNIGYECGNINQRKADIVNDPVVFGEKAMLFSISEPFINDEKGRVQTSFYNYFEGMDDIEGSGFETLHYSVRLFLPSNFDRLRDTIFEIKAGQLNMAEFFNNTAFNPEPEPDQFKFALSITKQLGSEDLNFTVASKIPGTTPFIWEYTDATYSIPLGEWIRLDIKIVEGDDSNGKFIMKVSGDEIFNITANTHLDNPTEEPDGINHMNLMKLYAWKTVIEKFSLATPAEKLEVYWDDFKIFDDSTLKKKYIKLINDHCGTACDPECNDDCSEIYKVTNSSPLITAQDVPGILGDSLPFNWKYKFRFQNQCAPFDVYTTPAQKRRDLDVAELVENGDLQQSVYNVRVAVKNHPFLYNFGGSNDNYCVISTEDVIVSKSDMIANEVSYLRVSPNPTSGDLSIDFTVTDAKSSTKLVIVDFNNTLVTEIFHGLLEKGSYQKQISLDRNELDKGIYFCVFNNGKNKIIKRILFQ